MQKRTTAAVLLTALALSLPASPALAGDRAPVRDGTAVATAKAPAKAPTAKAPTAKAPTAKAPTAKAPRTRTPKPRKARVVRATLNGLVTAVDATTVTFTVRSGSVRALRGTEVTVAATERTRVVRNDEVAVLADVQPGDRVTVRATAAGETWTAVRVVARGPVVEPAPTEPAPTEPAPTEPAPTEPTV